MELERAAVHVWRIRLDSSPPDSLDHLLSPEELGRAARFHFDRDRRRFLVSHTALRDVLSRYTGLEPACLQFDYGPHGKPFLPGAPIRFNLSHSGELALCAVAAGREVGVDVERFRAMPDLLAIARRFFTPAEASSLCGLKGDRLQAAFFETWTRKEAWLKATGQGIAGLGHTCPETWNIVALDIAPGYAAALALEGPAAVTIRDWRALHRPG